MKSHTVRRTPLPDAAGQKNGREDVNARTNNSHHEFMPSEDNKNTSRSTAEHKHNDPEPRRHPGQKSEVTHSQNIISVPLARTVFQKHHTTSITHGEREIRCFLQSANRDPYPSAVTDRRILCQKDERPNATAPIPAQDPLYRPELRDVSNWVSRPVHTPYAVSGGSSHSRRDLWAARTVFGSILYREQGWDQDLAYTGSWCEDLKEPIDSVPKL